MVDTLAHKVGKDPATLREENFIPKEAFPYHSPLGWEYDSGDYQAAMDKAKEMIGYDELRREQAEKRERGELMGIGVCSFTEVLGGGAVEGLRHPGDQDVRFGGGEGASDGEGDRPVRDEVAGPGARDDVCADHCGGARAAGGACPGGGGGIYVVDIDRGTGEVSVRRFVAVDDCGNIINPMIVQGQIPWRPDAGAGAGAVRGDSV